MQSLIVLDGYHGAGKTTIAKIVADRMNGTYVKPFRYTIGDTISWLAKQNRHDEVNILSKIAVERILSINNTNSPPLIFDRHWLSVFTLLPPKYLKNWEPLPLTFLLWANLDTTISRIKNRGDEIGDLDEYNYHIGLYKKIATQYGIPIIDTSDMTPDETVNYLFANYASLIG